MTDAERLFWYIRRLLGVRDTDDAPQVDAMIRQEIELRPTMQISLRRIKQRLGIT